MQERFGKNKYARGKIQMKCERKFQKIKYEISTNLPLARTRDFKFDG
jgi:hypothetical protein